MASLSVPGTVRWTKVYSITGFHACNNKHTVTSAKYKPCSLCACCHSIFLTHAFSVPFFFLFSNTCLAYFAVSLTLVASAEGLLLKNNTGDVLYFYAKEFQKTKIPQTLHPSPNTFCLWVSFPVCYYQRPKNVKTATNHKQTFFFFKVFL